MDRIDKLLAAAAEAFEDGRDPFSTDWLVEHDVTGQECMTLSELIAHAIEAWLACRRAVAALLRYRE